MPVLLVFLFLFDFDFTFIILNTLGSKDPQG